MDIEARLEENDISEILKYLEYNKQEIDDNLAKLIRTCMDKVNKGAKPKYIKKEYILSERGKLDGDLSILSGKNIKEHLKDCDRVIIFAATLGIDIDSLIRIEGIRDLTSSVIMDSCASTLIEAVCDKIDADIRLENKDKFFTFRFSPGYGDLPINIQANFLNLLDARKKIGLNVSSSGIMIPRKSVSAIIGISDIKQEKKSACTICENVKNCRFLKRGVRCGK